MQRATERPVLLFIATRVPYPPVTGHYLRSFNILRGLAERFRIHFFGFSDKNSTPDECECAKRALSELCDTVHIEPVGAERSRIRLIRDLLFSALTLKPFTAAKYSSRRMHREIHRLCRENIITIAHADSLQSGQYVIDLPIPKLITNHNVEYQRLYSYAEKRGISVYSLLLRAQARLTQRYERNILQTVGHCIAVSDNDERTLSQLAPSTQFYVVPNGTDTSAPPLTPAAITSHSALWVGGMNDPFNREAVLHFAQKIFPIIRSDLPNFVWTVVGRDPPPKLRALAERPNSGMLLSGFIPDLRDAYQNAAIVVVPLISGGGTKLKVLEAMAMGRAIVTTPIGAEGLAVHDGLHMEVATSDEDFAHRVITLLRDPSKRQGIASAARALAENEYSWSSISQRMNFAIQSTLDASLPRPSSNRPSTPNAPLP